jgi:hypothetical protein
MNHHFAGKKQAAARETGLPAMTHNLTGANSQTLRRVPYLGPRDVSNIACAETSPMSRCNVYDPSVEQR